MKVLILATDYPRPDGYVSQFFIHTRNIEYLNHGIDVTVLSFASKESYIYEGIKVITYNDYKNSENKGYDLLISHAPNIRNHYLFIKNFGDCFKKYLFFLHGHEVMIKSKIYPKQYPYIKKPSIKNDIINEVYDRLKLIILKRFFLKNIDKIEFICVSDWMYKEFLRFIKIEPKKLEGKVSIINNSVGKLFEENNYDYNKEKEYDFLTIRGNLDEPKYAIDVVSKIARSNPDYKFCLIGKGKYFEFNGNPKNLEFISKTLTHKEMIDFINNSKFTLMPTKQDSQGVISCEMATFGIPLITSNLDICKEIFSEFENVLFIDNNSEVDLNNLNLDKYVNRKFEKNKKYFNENTVLKEVELIKRMHCDIK